MQYAESYSEKSRPQSGKSKYIQTRVLESVLEEKQEKKSEDVFCKKICCFILIVLASIALLIFGGLLVSQYADELDVNMKQSVKITPIVLTSVNTTHIRCENYTDVCKNNVDPCNTTIFVTGFEFAVKNNVSTLCKKRTNRAICEQCTDMNQTDIYQITCENNILFHEAANSTDNLCDPIVLSSQHKNALNTFIMENTHKMLLNYEKINVIINNDTFQSLPEQDETPSVGFCPEGKLAGGIIMLFSGICGLISSVIICNADVEKEN